MKGTILLIILASIFSSCGNNSSSENSSLPNSTEQQTYEEKVMSVEETEKANPSDFLNAEGTYNENFWGDKFKIHGTVTNSATVASYKDLQIEVIFYSKTDTELDRKTYTLYERVGPKKAVNFEWKIEKPSGAVKKLGLKVLSATGE